MMNFRRPQKFVQPALPASTAVVTPEARQISGTRRYCNGKGCKSTLAEPFDEGTMLTGAEMLISECPFCRSRDVLLSRYIGVSLNTVGGFAPGEEPQALRTQGMVADVQFLRTAWVEITGE